MKKKVVILFFVFWTLLFSACGEKSGEKLNREFISRFYGDWEKVNSAGASSNGQIINSDTGVILSNTFNVSISVEWKKLITTSFGYDFTQETLKSTGTSKSIDKNQFIEFYIRPVYDLYEIERINKKGEREAIEYTSLFGGQWGWIIYDENNNILENTLEETIIKNEDNDVDNIEDIVESYIVRSETEIISTQELEELSTEELSLIRNGIYAYCGRKFEGAKLRTYYQRYDWYVPRYFENEFKWDFFNSYQQNTIYNIIRVEESKK